MFVSLKIYLPRLKPFARNKNSFYLPLPFNLYVSNKIYTKYPARRLSRNENPFYLPPFNLRLNYTKRLVYIRIHVFLGFKISLYFI